MNILWIVRKKFLNIFQIVFKHFIIFTILSKD